MSRLPFELLLAIRYLRPKRTFVSVITLISVLGVTLGVAVLIIVISVMTGFDKELRNKLLGFNTHLKVLPVGNRTMTNYRGLAEIIKSNSNVKAVAPFVMGQVLAETQPIDGQAMAAAPWVRGIDPNLETNITVLPASIIEGKFDVRNAGVLVGNELANNLGLSVGDLLTIYSPDELRKIRENQGKEGTSIRPPPDFEVRGIFNVGYYEYDVSVVVTSLEDAQELYALEGDVHGLLVMLHDPYDAPLAQEQLFRALGPDYTSRTWMQENSEILSALVVEKNVMFYLLFFIMIVAALCILSALITFVVQKTREIGMLKALGATDLQISVLFLSQSALIGAIGDLAGYGLGRLLVDYRNEFLFFMNRMTGFELFPKSIYHFTQLPAEIVSGDIILICVSAFLICTLGGVIPAWRAGRLKPVEALRYE